MNGCNPLFGFDAGLCAGGLFGAGLDWATGAIFGLPIWPLLILAAVALGFAYRQAGVTGLTAAAVGIGFLLGRHSMRVAQPGAPASETPRKLTKAEVEDLQRALKVEGFDPGPIDGLGGKLTRAALGRYQTKRKEPATGIPTEEQLKALGVWR